MKFETILSLFVHIHLIVVSAVLQFVSWIFWTRLWIIWGLETWRGACCST